MHRHHSPHPAVEHLSGGACTITASFAPNSAGPLSGQLLFYDNAAASNAPNTEAISGLSVFAQTIGVSGIGIASTANRSISMTNSPSAVAVGTLVHYTVKLTITTDSANPTAETYTDAVTVTSNTVPAPEPSALLLLAVGLSALCALRKRDSMNLDR
jgi:hypothetical protein